MDGYKDLINEYPNFPVEGVNFKDLSPLLADEDTFRSAVVDMGRQVKNPKYWVGIDSRGYIFASALSIYFGGGVICARKKGKASLELPEGSGEVVIVDDVLATGGTISATNKLAKDAGYNIVGNVVLVDLEYVPRIDNFDINVRSVIQYG
jgi:adenine phosphoribosyltransferase